jgi:hypothetical protein
LVNIKTGQRSTLKDHHVQQCDPVVYHVSNCAILAGGIYVYTNDTSRSVEMCDPTSNVWSFLLDMPQATSGATVGVIDKKVYVADGKGDGSWSLANLQVYDTVLETWKLGPEMPGYLSMTSGAVVENTLYIVGKSGATNNYVCVYFILGSKEWKYIDSIEPPGEYSMS